MDTPHPSMLAADKLSFESFRNEVLNDFYTACISREASLLGRKEVLTGKAKFGIFGDGKEVAQVAMAKFFKEGDFRSGYYRDQTFQFAIGQTTVEQFFAQLYADPDEINDPNSAGRQMVSHFCTPLTDEHGNWLDLANRKNTIADLAPTAAQMPRGLGVALASKCFRGIKALKQFKHLSDNGNEVCFVTIGDSATSEGHFWETVNAAGVMQVPMALFVWDDGYGISVPKKLQTTKASISEALSGFQKKDDSNGFHIYKVKGWDYAGMCEAFEEGVRLARETHTPALFHVDELTQPQGHSTSGSHERYKPTERLEWERDHDCIKKMRVWIIDSALATDEELNRVESKAKNQVKDERTRAWEKYQAPIKEQVKKITELSASLAANIPNKAETIQKLSKELSSNRDPMRRDVMRCLHSILNVAGDNDAAFWAKDYYNDLVKENTLLYNSHLYNIGEKSAVKVAETKAVIAANAPMINGFEILNKYFDALFANNPYVVAFGEDVGRIGDVNQGFSGLQAKYGEERIFDCGIRELSIMGQGIGIAMRGLRPIAEIQYLDYLLYGLEPLSDDAATLHFRTKGKQSCPLIVRTRGHRLEGIWHSGSPMGMVINSLRGMHVCVPRNMTQAVGMYNTLRQSMDPAIVIECLNGYRLKEKLPSNLLSFTVPLGVPEVVREGTDVTIVSYGSILRIIKDAANALQRLGISCEIIDVQTLLPFDIHHVILASLKKTNRIVFVDEDV
ncbi:MAG TPA: thiamine pyrophosphate-dependent enzyme, partial [Chitinophagaceae bacterium]|nr:thiamine pyrophosphate-dependent enzyme [Chitinophagaceae bacterium]